VLAFGLREQQVSLHGVIRPGLGEPPGPHHPSPRVRELAVEGQGVPEPERAPHRVYAAAFVTAGRAAELGTRCGDRHLVTVATQIKLRQTVSGCLRTLAGAEQFCAIRSYLATAAKHGIHFLESLVALAQGCPSLPETA